MIYGLLIQHIGLVNLPELIRAELRPPALDCRNLHLNGKDVSPTGAPPSPRLCFCG
jgi:hypothetical protein